MKLKTTFFQKAFLILLGIFLSLFLIEAGLRLGGFTLLAVQEHRNRDAIKKGGAYHILCLGESTTQGQWPPFLEAAINRSGAGIQFTVIDEGMAGTNTGLILSRVESYLNKYHPDMVVAMMGVNDHGAPHLPAETPSASKPELFVKSFKTYKLARLLFHMAFKTNRWALPPKNTHAQPPPQPARHEIVPDAENPGVKKLKKELELNPENGKAYFELGRLYWEQGKFQQAEMHTKKALQINPGNDETYLQLGWLYQEQGKFRQAEIYIKKALKLNPANNKEAYHELGWLYLKQRKFKQAEIYIKKALLVYHGIDHVSGAEGVYLQFGELYREQGKILTADIYTKRALKQINPGNSRARYRTEGLYRKRGQFHQAEESYYRKANLLYISGYNPLTANHYHALKTILDKRKIRLVCVQYPMHNVGPLKNIFAEQADDIVFVDNEKIFREAVKKEGYGAYFLDRIDADFGHCKRKGNKLLGENIARVILREVFHKKFQRNKAGAGGV
ncbi:MAG: hypothetical protein A2X34_09955 [Elusimicrobia bacterium GWC2_51_8]|nr:MAG: hypothetical protein A2X33_06935 [Elusimicrobia bacterium GWA2_51_34]OGR58223.1 MAG: hypothetical protein A2X34_09955 [Elusimicrobia bacterium GWC2_51_8]OGR85679.1 MAG: hypothetical protein A2021_00820 [Elusimicrobia bacterium GWF2_52_66]HAF95462.1 hypothetical protein [Elusimicrobiota bacterium]HCE98124.1 hypothetical protein [Elusimicrobiota bacterium]